MEQKNYMPNQSSSTDQSLNTSNQNTNNFSYNIISNSYYNPNFKKNPNKSIENPKVMMNKIIPQKESVYSINYQNKKIIKNNESFDLSIKKQNIDNSSFYSQKPIQTFELKLNNINNNNKINNIVNIDNHSSAFELCFIAKKKPKKDFKINVIYQIGPEQKPLSFAFYAMNNKKNIDELNIQMQNASFISNKQIENNSFVDNEINFMNNIPNKKNELKIMQNPGRKSENKPKPILQIMTSDNKNNFSKKLSESNLPRVNGFNLEDNNNELLKNNFVNISKSASMIVNNNQDISFISNSKETENLLEMNGINIDNNYYNKNIINSVSLNGYIMTNEQLIFIAEKNNNNKNKNNISSISNNSLNNSLNKKSAKKYIKIEYYDTQPVFFDIISEINSEENIENEIKLSSYKMYRVEEMEFINNKENEEKSLDKEENKSFNNTNNKKRKRRKKKK